MQLHRGHNKHFSSTATIFIPRAKLQTWLKMSKNQKHTSIIKRGFQSLSGSLMFAEKAEGF